MKKKSKVKTKKTAKKPNLKKRASQRVLSAAAQLRRTTKKLVDDVFLKLVGSKVLARSEEIQKTMKKERKSKKKK
ncbi:MAG: hypothetical protein ACAH59_04065 [Pseudobdellovibrionaceae bacterium]